MTAIAELHRVTFAYARPTARTRPFGVADLSLDVRRGEILSVIGPNSAGKTTLVRLLTGVVAPTAGEVLIDGEPLSRLGPAELARRIAVVPQELPTAFPFTVEELVVMGRYPHAPERYFETDEDRAIARDAMAATGVLDLAAAPLEILSGGERQRAVIARALAQRPRLLVLDEPTAHLDLRHQAECARLLARVSEERGVTIVLVSHDLALAGELSDRIVLLAEGRIVAAGPPDGVLDAAVLEEAFRCRVVVDRSASTGRPVARVAWDVARSASAREKAR